MKFGKSVSRLLAKFMLVSTATSCFGCCSYAMWGDNHNSHQYQPYQPSYTYGLPMWPQFQFTPMYQHPPMSPNGNYPNYNLNPNPMYANMNQNYAQNYVEMEKKLKEIEEAGKKELNDLKAKHEKEANDLKAANKEKMDKLEIAQKEQMYEFYVNLIIKDAVWWTLKDVFGWQTNGYMYEKCQFVIDKLSGKKANKKESEKINSINYGTKIAEWISNNKNKFLEKDGSLYLGGYSESHINSAITKASSLNKADVIKILNDERNKYEFRPY